MGMSTLYAVVTHSGAPGFPDRGVSWFATKGEALKKMEYWARVRDDVLAMEVVKGEFPSLAKKELELRAANCNFDPDETRVVKEWKR